jgi:hypothetical protein
MAVDSRNQSPGPRTVRIDLTDAYRVLAVLVPGRTYNVFLYSTRPVERAIPSQFPSHSRAFGGGRDRPFSSVVPGHVLPRPALNGQQHNWKACWGNPQEFESLIFRQCHDLAKRRACPRCPWWTRSRTTSGSGRPITSFPGRDLVGPVSARVCLRCGEYPAFRPQGLAHPCAYFGRSLLCQTRRIPLS